MRYESHPLGNKTQYNFYGTSGESKPTDQDMANDKAEDIAVGSTFLEVDTGDVYFYNEIAGTWHKVGGDNA